MENDRDFTRRGTRYKTKYLDGLKELFGEIDKDVIQPLEKDKSAFQSGQCDSAASEASRSEPCPD